MTAFNDIFDKVKSTSKLDAEIVRKLLSLMVKANLDALQEDQLFQLLAKKSSIAKTAIRKEYHRVRSQEGHPPTDLGVSLAQAILKDEFNDGHGLMYMQSAGFFKYGENRWETISEQEIKNRVLPFVGEQKAYFNERPVYAVVNEVIACLKSLVLIYKMDTEIQPVINTSSCELWLENDGSYQTKLHSPDSFQFSALPYKYDPDAKADLYSQTMLEIFAVCSDPDEVLRHWNEFLGYLIQPKRFIPSVFFMMGGGQNGKSTAYSIIKELVGDASHNTDFRSFQKDNFKYRSLINKLVVVDEDTHKDLVLDTGFLKKQSENSWMNARSPHKLDTLEFQNTALPLLISNHAPKCNDTTYGWRRRVYVFPFDRFFKEQEVDPERFEKIREKEMSGILNCALAGYMRIRQRGNKFDVPKDCIIAQEKFIEASNLLITYLNHNLEKATGNYSYIHLSVLRNHMDLWFYENGYSAEAPYKKLAGELRNLGYTVGDMNGRAALKGFKIIDNKDAP